MTWQRVVTDLGILVAGIGLVVFFSLRMKSDPAGSTIGITVGFSLIAAGAGQRLLHKKIDPLQRDEDGELVDIGKVERHLVKIEKQLSERGMLDRQRIHTPPPPPSPRQPGRLRPPPPRE